MWLKGQNHILSSEQKTCGDVAMLLFNTVKHFKPRANICFTYTGNLHSEVAKVCFKGIKWQVWNLHTYYTLSWSHFACFLSSVSPEKHISKIKCRWELTLSCSHISDILLFWHEQQLCCPVLLPSFTVAPPSCPALEEKTKKKRRNQTKKPPASLAFLNQQTVF